MIINFSSLSYNNLNLIHVSLNLKLFFPCTDLEDISNELRHSRAFPLVVVP